MAEDAVPIRVWRRPQVQAFTLGVATSIVATEVLNGLAFVVEQVQGVPPWLVVSVVVVVAGGVLALGIPRSRATLKRAWVGGLGTLTVVVVLIAAIGLGFYGLTQYSASQNREAFLWTVRHGVAGSSFAQSADTRYLAAGSRVCLDVSRGMTKAQYDASGAQEVNEPAAVREAIYRAAVRELCATATASPNANSGGEG